MIVWGGVDGNSTFEYRRQIQSRDKQLDSYEHIKCPAGRVFHTAVWTGSEMIVWGGDSMATV